MGRRPHRPSQRAFGPRREPAAFDNRGHRRQVLKTPNHGPRCVLMAIPVVALAAHEGDRH
jgi:hypothetical protein